MSVIRAFIAIDLSTEILQHLDRISKELQTDFPRGVVRWVPSENIHLTLKFLGDVSLKNLDLVTDALTMETYHYSPFTISVGGIGAFPKMSNPRVIWVGVQAPDELLEIQHGIESHMERVGYARERRSFSAHLTLGRVSRSATPQQVRLIADGLSRYTLGFLGLTNIDAVHLYKSDLRPDGAVYSRIFTATLDRRPG